LLQYISIKNKYEGEPRIFVLRRRIEFFIQYINRITMIFHCGHIFYAVLL